MAFRALIILGILLVVAASARVHVSAPHRPFDGQSGMTSVAAEECFQRRGLQDRTRRCEWMSQCRGSTHPSIGEPDIDDHLLASGVRESPDGDETFDAVAPRGAGTPSSIVAQLKRDPTRRARRSLLAYSHRESPDGDAFGNRKTIPSRDVEGGTLASAATTNDTTNAVTSFGGIPIGRDGRGNTTSIGSQFFLYDTMGHQICWTDDINTLTNVVIELYDAEDRRVYRYHNGVERFHVWDGQALL